jgi:hypothetical protein
MDINPAILVTSYLAMMALGIYVVVKAIRNPPRGGPSEISLLGSKLTLKGPGWLVMIVVGALMTAIPVIAAAIEHNSQFPFELPVAAKEVSKIDEPDYKDFLFVRDVTYLDLRSSLKRPWYAYIPGWGRLAGHHVHTRPARLLNYMQIRKIGDANEIHMKYVASGLLDMRCLTHPYSLQTSFEEDQNVGEIIADVRSVPVNTEFTLITQVTYWNSFSGSAGEDFTTYTHKQSGQTEDISSVIVFPDSRPFKTVDTYQKAPDSDALHPFQGSSQQVRGPQNLAYYWATTGNSGQWFYTLRWTW